MQKFLNGAFVVPFIDLSCRAYGSLKQNESFSSHFLMKTFAALDWRCFIAAVHVECLQKEIGEH